MNPNPIKQILQTVNYLSEKLPHLTKTDQIPDKCKCFRVAINIARKIDSNTSQDKDVITNPKQHLNNDHISGSTLWLAFTLFQVSSAYSTVKSTKMRQITILYYPSLCTDTKEQWVSKELRTNLHNVVFKKWT